MRNFVFDNDLFSKIQDSNIVFYKASIQDYMRKRAYQESIDSLCKHKYVDKECLL